MCIICVKRAGVKMPPADVLKTMYTNNPDGAGYMYADGEKVHIHKGFMTYDAFDQSLQYLSKKYDLKKLPIVFHFRISTAGGICPANTHPFPVSESLKDLQKTRCKASFGMAHNGIIKAIDGTKTTSDTMQFILKVVAPMRDLCPDFMQSKTACQMLRTLADSKLCFMDIKGNIKMIGDFHKDSGLYYSNYSYIDYAKYAYNYYDDYTYTAPTVPAAPAVKVKNNFLPKGTYLLYNYATDLDDITVESNGHNLQQSGNCIIYTDDGNDFYFDNYIKDYDNL